MSVSCWGPPVSSGRRRSPIRPYSICTCSSCRHAFVKFNNRSGASVVNRFEPFRLFIIYYFYFFFPRNVWKGALFLINDDHEITETKCPREIPTHRPATQIIISEAIAFRVEQNNKIHRLLHRAGLAYCRGTKVFCTTHRFDFDRCRWTFFLVLCRHTNILMLTTW